MLAAVVLGALLAYLFDGTRYLGWLAWGKTLGVNGFSVDLYVLKFSLSLTLNVTLSQLITVPLGLVVYAKAGKSL